MTDSQGAATAAPKSEKVEKEIGYIGARLREKSTYAGLTVVLAALLPLLAKYAPALAHTDPGTLVGDLSSIGIGVGGLIAIFTPENGSKAIIAALATSGALALAQPMPASAQPAVAAVHHVHHVRHIAQAIPLPAARPNAIPANAILDAGKAPAASSAQLTAAQVQQNPLVLIQQFTIADLQNALALAQAQTPVDQPAINCWNALLPLVQSLQAPGAPNSTGPTPFKPGVATLIQDSRDAQALIANLQSPTGPLANVNNACAPVVVQLQTTLTLLGVGGGVVAAAGPTAAAPAVAALNALLLAIPKPILPFPLP